MKVFISSSISIKSLGSSFIAHVEQIVKNKDMVLIGDAYGVDKVVQGYLVERGYHNVVVYFSGDRVRNNLGCWPTPNLSNRIVI